MKIQLSKSDLTAAKLNWNILTNKKNKDTNYCIPTSLEESSRFDMHSARLEINQRWWFLQENSLKAFTEIFNRIYNSPGLRSFVSYKTVYTALREELELEISSREKDPENKREFVNTFESIQNSIGSKISYFDFFFTIEGLELENIEKINCGKVEIFIFNQELRDELTSAYFGMDEPQSQQALEGTQKFLDDNFLHQLCIKSSAHGDFELANKKAYRQARELINYFRFILCFFTHERVSEQIIKINLSSEIYSNGEKTVARSHKDESISLSYGRGRRSLQKFSIGIDKLKELTVDGFLNQGNRTRISQRKR
jgi:hypothetical protein